MVAHKQFSSENPLRTWQQRVASQPPKAHILGGVVNAFDELRQEGKRLKKPIHKRTGMPHFTPEELDDLIANMEDHSALKAAWKDARLREKGDLWNYQDNLYNTGSKHAVAFKNIRTSPPISILVCPTKPYYTFTHFISKASPQEIGDFFKSVLKAAKQATTEFDDAISAESDDSVRKTLRSHYEQEFDRIRELRTAAGKKGLTEKQEKEAAKIFKSYMNDSREHRFAVRDPRTGKSGFRVAVNDGAAASGNSQAHFHVQILGGMFLGAPSNDMRLTADETKATAKVITR